MNVVTASVTGNRRTLLALAALLILVAVVAVAAAGHAPATGEKAPSTSAPSYIADYLGTFFFLMVPLGALIVVWSQFMRRVEIAEKRVPRTSRVGALVVAALVLGIALVRVTHRGWIGGGHPARTIPPATHVSSGRSRPKPTVAPRTPRFQWPVVFVAGSLALAFVTSVGLLALRRRRGELGDRATVEAALADAVDQGLDELRNEPNARKAVIRTYARMERTFAARGMPRQPFEAPLEYLARIVAIAQVSAHSVLRLTQLFSRARFSTHGVDTRMKDDAIEALAALRAELEAPH